MRAKHICYTQSKAYRALFTLDCFALQLPKMPCVCTRRKSQLAKYFKDFEFCEGAVKRIKGPILHQHVLFPASGCEPSRIEHGKRGVALSKVQFLCRQKILILTQTCHLTALPSLFWASVFLLINRGTRPGDFPRPFQLGISVLSLLLLWKLSHKDSAFVGCDSWR